MDVDLSTIDPVRDVMPWFMSAITLYMTFLQGRKTWKAWAWGLANQGLWLVFVVVTSTWGLLPLNLGLWYLYVRNLRLWYQEEQNRRRLMSDTQWVLATSKPPPTWGPFIDESTLKPRECVLETCGCNPPCIEPEDHNR